VNVISILNQKGGSGKSSTAVHVGGALALLGHRTLLVDNDPQASLTQGVFGPEVARRVGEAESVTAVYDPHFAPAPEALIQATGLERLSILPGSGTLADRNMTPRAGWPGSEDGLRDFLDEVRDRFDVVLIDCAPNLYLCSWAALVASDFLVTPLQPEDFGAQGIPDVSKSVALVQAGPNPALRLAGYLLTMTDKRLGIHAAYETMLRELYGPAVFTNHFPLAKDYKEAVAARAPIGVYKPRSAAAKAVRAIAEELLERVSTRAEGVAA
jgi:chromosome partitioning protein